MFLFLDMLSSFIRRYSTLPFRQKMRAKIFFINFYDMTTMTLEDLGKLPPQQLLTLTRQVEAEIQFFVSSLKDLKTAVASFQRSEDAVRETAKCGDDKPGLVPLTDTIFARAKLAKAEKFLIDIGTNYYVEMTAEEAQNMFARKRSFVEKQIKTIEDLLKDKQIILAVAKDALKTKAIQASAS
uniref:Prefoldin subunit 5 n=1 Tax=Panagrolaimus sp. JU765 TaxID=591449 RepID=A0AC34R1U2_9BILA